MSIINSSFFERKKACEKLIKESVPNQEFYFLLIGASFLAAAGIIINNVVIIIGAMLIAPLLSSFLIIGLGLVISNKKVIIKKTITTIKAVLISVFTAFVAGIFLKFEEINPQLLIRENFIEFLFISFVAGIIGTYIWVKADLQNISSGVLVAVTILPPLASLGVGISILNKEVINNSFLFFIVNSFGLLLGSVLMFIFFGFGKNPESIEKEIEEKIEKYENGEKK